MKVEAGKLIKEQRVKKGLTQEELAKKSEVSTRTIQRIENGEVEPRAYTLQMIAKALDFDFSQFVENESDEGQETHKTNANIWLGFLHLSGIIPLIFPTLLIWNLKKDKIKGITEHYRAVLTFQLIILGVILGCLWVFWKVNQPIPLIGVILGNGLFSITNTIKVMNGDPYINMPLIKMKKTI